MVSLKLIQLIETHKEEIAHRLVSTVRKHPDMLPHLAGKSDAEMREWCRLVLGDLCYLLSGTKEEEVPRRFEVIGRKRYEENVPLHEAILRPMLLKRMIIGFIHEQDFAMSAVQLYAAEELELRIGRFFDDCVYEEVRGYEAAMRIARRAA
jgi:hypothetical protein